MGRINVTSIFLKTESPNVILIIDAGNQLWQRRLRLAKTTQYVATLLKCCRRDLLLLHSYGGTAPPVTLSGCALFAIWKLPLEFDRQGYPYSFYTGFCATSAISNSTLPPCMEMSAINLLSCVQQSCLTFASLCLATRATRAPQLSGQVNDVAAQAQHHGRNNEIFAVLQSQVMLRHHHPAELCISV